VPSDEWRKLPWMTLKRRFATPASTWTTAPQSRRGPEVTEAQQCHRKKAALEV
jgi:hypothetical protein